MQWDEILGVSDEGPVAGTWDAVSEAAGAIARVGRRSSGRLPICSDQPVCGMDVKADVFDSHFVGKVEEYRKQGGGGGGCRLCWWQ